MSGKDEKPAKGLGSRIVKAARDAAASALRNVAGKLEGPHEVFEVEDIKIDFHFDVEGETVWATQNQMAQLFGVDQPAIAKHIRNIFEINELEENSTTHSKMELVQKEGGRDVKRSVSHYNLDVIMTVGYRVSSGRAAAFRKWANGVLRRYLVEGFALNDKRLRNDPVALRSLVEQVRTLRTDEKNLYAQVRECFKITASDYDGKSDEARRFYTTLQEKFTYAASEHTSAELILKRADGSKSLMGMSACLTDRPTLKDAQTAKNYLEEDELHYLKLVCDSFLNYIEGKAMKNKKLTMAELLVKMDAILEFYEMPVFQGYKSGYLRDKADAHAKRQLDLFNAREGQKRYAKARGITPPT